MGLPDEQNTTHSVPELQLIHYGPTGIPNDKQPRAASSVEDEHADDPQQLFEVMGYHLNGALNEVCHTITEAMKINARTVHVHDYGNIDAYHFRLIRTMHAYLLYETTTCFINIHQLSYLTCGSFTYSTGFYFYTPEEEFAQSFSIQHPMVGGVYAPPHSVFHFFNLFLRSPYRKLGVNSLLQFIYENQQ